MILKGESVYLTSYTDESLGLLYAWHQDEDFDKMMSDEAGPKSTDMLKKIYGNFMFPYGRLFVVTVRLSDHLPADEIKSMGPMYERNPDANIPVGVIALKDINMKNRRAELYGGVGLRSMRGKGFSRDAIKTLLVWSQEELGLRRIYAVVREDNKLSANTLKNCGFIMETSMKDYLYTGRKFINASLFAHTKRVQRSEGS